MSGPQPAHAQVGPLLSMTMNLAGPAKAAGGSYFIGLTADDTMQAGPQSDTTNWTHYIMYRGGQFFFGTVPSGPRRPFAFLIEKPPAPYRNAWVPPDGRSLEVRVSVLELLTVANRIRVTFVTAAPNLIAVDALGKGPGDPSGFVTVDLRFDRFVTISHTAPHCSDPSFCITGGSIRVTML